MRFLLLPFSWIYGAVVFLRNRLYDWRVFKENTFDVPLIVIGNLSLGGTGKTPHVEYLICLLASNYRVAVLSRGYGRKTKGYILAKAGTSPHQIGDEPHQIFSKFPGLTLAVCEDRTYGINKLLAEKNPPEVILLDDAFQHRKIKAGMNVVLTEFNRPYYTDYMIPTGRLRDNKREINRAQVLIHTKVPSSENLEAVMSKTKRVDGLLNCYSSFQYLEPTPYFEKNDLTIMPAKIIVVTGIANPQPLLDHLRTNYEILEALTFPDHKDFNATDVAEIMKKRRKFAGETIGILTTEKDYVKLVNLVNPTDNFYYLPIAVKLITKKDEFNQLIFDYINSY